MIYPRVKEPDPYQENSSLLCLDCHFACYTSVLLFVGIVLLGECLIPPVSFSQGVPSSITPDGSLGTVVTKSGAVHGITGGTRPGDGPNLFHSFGQFNVSVGEVANFMNDAGLPTENILSRVTGGDASQILGTIQTTDFGGANLFLMNPAGVVFGPNASLDVSGSFHVSTADFIRLGEGGEFHADLGRESLLTAAPPEAFGFLQNNPAMVTVDQSDLEVSSGNSISIIAGDIEIIGPGFDGVDQIIAPSGRVTIVSVGSPGEVSPLSFDEENPVNVDSFERLGTINVNQTAEIRVSGDPAGTVVVRGGSLFLEGGITTSNRGSTDHPGVAIDIGIRGALHLKAGPDGAQIAGSSFGDGNAGDIHIRAGSIELVGRPDLDNADANIGSRSSFGVPNFGTPPTAGDGGNVFITTDRLILRDRAFISTAAFGDGNAGDITIRANSIELLGDKNVATITSFTTGVGDAGNIDIQADDFLVSGGPSSLLTGLGAGTFGENATGSSGTITVQSNVLELRKGGQISSSTSFGASGAGGTVDILAKEKLIISERSVRGSPPGIFVNSTNLSKGDAGSINIVSPSIEVSKGGQISAFSNSFGNSGSVEVETKRLVVANDSFIEATNFGAGEAGRLVITAEDVVLTGPIPANAFSQPGLFAIGGFFAKSAGNITLETKSLSILQGAQILARTAGGGKGGTIDIAADQIVIDGFDLNSPSGDPRSGILADTRSFQPRPELATGKGGDVIIASGSIGIHNNGVISVQSASLGDGGNIVLASESLNMSTEGAITAQAMTNGNAGTIDVSVQGSIQLQNSSITSAANQGIAGDISIKSGNDIFLTDGSFVSAETLGPGNAGKINLQAQNSIVLEQSTIKTLAVQADGGDIKLTASDTIQLTDSLISSSVGGGPSTVGGNINLDPDFIILTNSDILARAGVGQGGQIQLTANVVLADPFSNISASAGPAGISGTVSIRAPIQNLSGTIAPLPEDLVKGAQFYASRCAAQKGGKLSSFVYHKVPVLPVQPGDFMNSHIVWTEPDNAVRFANKKSGSAERNLPNQTARFFALQPANIYTGGLSSFLQSC